MIIETRPYKKMECDLELEMMLGLLWKPRKDSSFYDHDKPKYEELINKNERLDTEIK